MTIVRALCASKFFVALIIIIIIIIIIIMKHLCAMNCNYRSAKTLVFTLDTWFVLDT